MLAQFRHFWLIDAIWKFFANYIFSIQYFRGTSIFNTLFLLVFFVLVILVDCTNLPAFYAPYVDDTSVWDTLSFFAKWNHPEVSSKYPVFPYLINSVFIGIGFLINLLAGNFTHLASSFPYGFKNPEWGIGVIIFMIRLSNIFVLHVLLNRLAKLFPDKKKSSILIVLLFLFLPINIYYASTSNRDFIVGAFMAMAIVSFYSVFYLRIQHRIFEFLFYSIIAFHTKDFAGIFCFAMLVLMLVRDISILKLLFRNWGKTALLITFFIFLILLYNPARSLLHYQHWALGGTGVSPFREFATGSLPEIYIFLKHIFLNYLFKLEFGLLLLLIALRKDVRLIWISLLLTLLYLATTIIPIGFILPRFVIPVLAVLAMALLMGYLNQPDNKNLLFTRAVVVFFAFISIVYQYNRHSFHKNLDTDLNALMVKDKLVYAGGISHFPDAGISKNANFYVADSSAALFDNAGVRSFSPGTAGTYTLVSDKQISTMSFDRKIIWNDSAALLSTFLLYPYHDSKEYYFYSVR